MGKAPGYAPTRTCVGCRQRCAAPELVRLALVEGRVRVVLSGDPVRGKAGRGAWIHARPECIKKAVTSRAFGRAFRASVEAVPEGDLLAALGVAT